MFLIFLSTLKVYTYIWIYFLNQLWLNNINVYIMEDNYYTSADNQKLYINYFDALYLLNIVFKENKEYEFIDKSHIESIWNSTDYK